ncbi:DUF6074 family protein [Bradyrhizobium sp. CCGUVB1N3]|uniref:DUF6074 family protein n=1 Tax=Bradyrhizobium sp. CCGUVB1N3 TaxID=2949629 RepID=UPI0020B2B1F7|nr:DUF6074 family protein [Bradyrhizobium sp. CCGUVB1N3]MCP3469823.1 DUF6074 family protein [Bradyrhizobium sp. CCGUVB1N3]
MGSVLPFPVIRRQAFIQRQAVVVAELNETAGERYIQHQLRIQRDAMMRKGIDTSLIERELRCLETSIRAALSKFLVTA